MAAIKDLRPGDPAPWFEQKSSSNPRYVFDTAAGRHLLLCFFGSAGDDHARAAIEAVGSRGDLFDDRRASFFGVSMDPADEAGRVEARIPGYRYFWDSDGLIGKLYGVVPPGFKPGDRSPLPARRWVLLDMALRVVEVIPFADDRSDITRILDLVDRSTTPESLDKFSAPAPVLYLPRVLEPELCEELLDYCQRQGVNPSGFMVEENGRTVLRSDSGRKRRTDCEVMDESLKERIRMRITRRIVPEIAKAFQFPVTRIERYLIGRYEAEDLGYFNPHRDNTTRGTAHRRFAVTLALNEEYEGGTLRFPEFGNRPYKPAAGGAVVFSCSLLHTVDPVTSGVRYVFIPFLYDDAAAKIRERNRKFLDVK
jgi:predicted 2-oxoglutarate/Fe(II)-dependent dioxygenase YbiX/peroxiredoxin